MIFIVVKFPVLPEHSDNWPTLVADFTAGTRSEPGNLFFDWSRSVDDPNEWVVVEAFRDDAAGAAHVGSDHFAKAMSWMPDYISATPKIVNVKVDGDGWSAMGELSPRGGTAG